MKQTLGKQEKLKSRKQIDQLFKSRRFVTQPPIRLFYELQQKPISNGVDASLTGTISSGAPIQVGFSCSKKFFKQATRRNRVKRLLREAYRKRKAPLWALCEQHGCTLNLFWLYGHKELPSSPEIEQKVELLINVLIEKLEKKLSTQS